MYRMSEKIRMPTVGFCWFCLKCRHSSKTLSMGAFPCGFISGGGKKGGSALFSLIWTLVLKNPRLRNHRVVSAIEDNHSTIRAVLLSLCSHFYLSKLLRPALESWLVFAWVMSIIDRNYKLIRNCKIFNGAIEDTKRGREWRIIERRLPSVSSQQSDLLITHCFGGFIILFMQTDSRASQSEEGSIQYYRGFVLPHCDGTL